MSSSVLKSTVNPKSPQFEKNAQRMVELLTALKNEEETIREGGGAKAPGLTEAVIVIAVCGSERLERLSQVAAPIAQAANGRTAAAKRVGWYFGWLVILLLQ